MSKTHALCFIRGPRDLETIKALGLRPRAFICFSVSGTPDETLALVFDILPQISSFRKCLETRRHLGSRCKESIAKDIQNYGSQSKYAKLAIR